MDVTQFRGYPYPECAPPYVADAADLPLDLYNLATAIDTDLLALNARVSAIHPQPAGKINNSAPPAVAKASGSTVSFNNIDGFTTGVTPNTTLGRLELNVSGVWLATAGFLGTTSVAASAFQLALLQNGTTIATRTWNQAAIASANGNLSTLFIGNAGDNIMLQTNFASGTTTMTGASLAVVRVVVL